jgi:hypothetical protein
MCAGSYSPLYKLECIHRRGCQRSRLRGLSLQKLYRGWQEYGAGDRFLHSEDYYAALGLKHICSFRNLCRLMRAGFSGYPIGAEHELPEVAKILKRAIRSPSIHQGMPPVTLENLDGMFKPPKDLWPHVAKSTAIGGLLLNCARC